MSIKYLYFQSILDYQAVIFNHLLHLPVSRKTERDDSEAFLGGRVASGSPTGTGSAKPSRRGNPLSRETLPQGGSEMTRIRCAENIVFFVLEFLICLRFYSYLHLM